MSALFLLILGASLVLLSLGLTRHEYTWNVNAACDVKIVADNFLVQRAVDVRPPPALLVPVNSRRIRFMGLGFNIWEDREWIPQVGTTTGTCGPTSYARRMEFVLPLWWILVLSAVLPFRLVIRLVERRLEVKPGMCRQCGYDLRASPERCPECGTHVLPLIKP